jgi:hypothetical protein
VIYGIYHEYHRRIVDNIPSNALRNVVESLQLLRDAIEKTPLLDEQVCEASAKEK